MTLDARYLAALRRYVRRADEGELAEAWEFGRASLAAGITLLDLARAHTRAVCALLSSRNGDPAEVSSRATVFLAQALTPYEMALSGYRESNAALRRANDALETRTRQLDELNRELEAFSYSVSHDLRAPLRAIEGFSAILVEDHAGSLGPEARALLDRVRGGAARMNELIDDLLRLSRVTRGELDPTSVNVSRIADEVARALAATAPGRVVDWSIEDGIVVRGDAGLLRVVIENILGNAWKFTNRKPRARIEVGALRDAAGFYVRDDGAGFDPVYADRLFRPFQRLHRAEDFPGAGIGLATVQRIVHRHGGRVHAQGRPGDGATFVVELPPAPTADHPAGASA